MKLLREVANSGVHFAKNPSHRRSILLSNLVSVILFGLGMFLFVAYYLWYGWSVVTFIIPTISVLCLGSIVLNRMDLSTVSRAWLTLLVPVACIALSIYAKQIYYDQQEELDYFTFRFVILGSCLFPAVFFSFREKSMLVATSLIGFLILIMHDPLHTYFGVPYQKDVLKESNYAFTNIVIGVTYFTMLGAVMFLKYTSEKTEIKADKLIEKLNQINAELLEKNSEIEAQNLEISAQTENLNISQDRLQGAYRVIEEQKNLLLAQNQNLSSELVEKHNDLSATNAELIKHNNELRQFSYTVSHNLRGPLASLMGLISLIDQRNLNEGNAEIFNYLKTSVGRLDHIISDLGKIIDIRHDIFQIREKINLDTELNSVLQVFKKDIELHNVTIEKDFSGCQEIFSVRPMVHSILYNLISNAIKYKAPDRRPEIKLSSRVNGSYIISVSDNGLGIDLKNHKDNLFKLYKRFHYHTEGKGLGLYLVKLQAESLGGRVEVFSELNRQTTFTVYLGQPENVDRQILYEQPYAEIFFDARLNSTGVIWKGPISSEQYRSVFVKCLEFVKVYNTPNYIADLTEQGFIGRDDQQWMFTEILPEAAQYGMRRIAGVVAPNAEKAVQVYYKGIRESLKKLGIEQEFFFSMSAAADWLKTENTKSSLSLDYDRQANRT
jgi:signal transduction histidine kinase